MARPGEWRRARPPAPAADYVFREGDVLLLAGGDARLAEFTG